MPTTEIATIPLVAGSQIGDPDNHASPVHKDCAATVSQQDGFQTLQFGMGVENPGTLQWMIDWDSKKKHEEFMASSTYTPFLENFKTIIGGPISLIHVDFNPSGGAKKALSAPVTEIATFYFEGGPADDAFDGAKKFLETCMADQRVDVPWAYGITHEELEKDGVKGKGAVLLVGWESVDQHMELRKTDVFKENIHLLRQNAKGIEMHHTQFMNYVE